MSTIEFTEEAIRDHLDNCIRLWRSHRNKEDGSEREMELKQMAPYYIDAYQSVRISLFGELLGVEEGDV